MDPFPLWKLWLNVGVFAAVMAICFARPTPFLRVVRLCALGQVAYGVVQDQFSARLAPEYFTVGHPPITGLADPTLVAVTWGLLGAFPGGLILGVVAGLVATAGPRPKIEVPELVRPLGLLLVFQAVVTVIAGFSGDYNARMARIRLDPAWESLIPANRQLPFFAVACAHFGTYAAGLIGSLVLCGWIGWRRFGRRG